MTSRRHSLTRVLAVTLAAALALSPSALAVAPPEPPPGNAVDGDVVAGAEAAGLNAGEWQAAMLGSTTATAPRGAVQAILENPRTDMVVFYKNVNASLVADEDDAYHVFARRCGVRTTLTEDCDPGDIVFDHLVFTRTARTDGGYDFDILALTAENPVGTVLAVPGVNPFGDPHAPGPVVLADADDPRRDPSALATLADETAAGTGSIDETGVTAVEVVRPFIPPEETTYPYPYERFTAELDDADAGDLLVNPVPAGATGNRGNHGALSVTQSRATLLVSGRGARRTALDPDDERAMTIKHVDLAPTVAHVLGVPPHVAGQLLNNGDAAANPAADPPLLRRQDGEVAHGLLEPRVNTFVVVIDGLIPENVNATLTPNICNLIDCPGAAAPDATARATVYTAARAIMVTQTNANHTAMLTGAYGETSGVVANAFFDRALAAERALESPALIRVDTLFDVLRQEAPHLKTAAVLGKEKLRDLYDCTHDAGGSCITDDPNNPEGVPVTHVRPDFIRGAAETPAVGTDDCPAESASGSGVALDDCVMDIVITLSATEDPDFTFVNLANVDSIQHVSGPNSPAAIAAIALADLQVGRLVGYLKEAGKWQDSVLIITADHSFSWQGPDTAQRIDLESSFTDDPTIGATGEGFTLVGNGGTTHVYLDSIGVTTAGPLGVTQETALRRMREIALAEAGVSEAWYRFENSQDPGQTLAANRPDWHLDDQRAGDLIITTLASGPTAGLNDPNAPGTNAFEVVSGTGFVAESPFGTSGVLEGDHGHPGARHVPFIVVGGGDHVADQTITPTGTVNEGDDTAANPGQAEAVDVASTVAWIYGLDPASVLPDGDGRALTEAFTGVPIELVEPHANRAIIFIFDGNNSVRMHDVMADCTRQPDDTFACGDPLNLPLDAVRSLLFRDGDGRIDIPQGTLTSFGSMASFPTVTFPNHNVVGSGVHPGHHGIVGNSYYERDIELERDPIDPTDPRNPLFFFSSALLRLDFETLHEAVHRAFGDWMPAPEDPGCDPATEVCNGPSGAFTASVNEPSARGADFASLETVSSDTLPGTFAFLTGNVVEFVEDTTTACAEESPDGYGSESVLDHLGQAQGRALFAEPSTGTLPIPDGVVSLVIDETGGAQHPDPKYMIENFTLTDGSGHEFGPHGACTRAGYRDTSSRLGRVLGELANHGRFKLLGEPARLGETFILLTGDHGMENQDQGAGSGYGTELGSADIEYVQQGRGVYLLTMRVELSGPYNPGEQTVTLRVGDDDAGPDGWHVAVAGATVEAQNGAEIQSDTTDANGEVTFTFVQPVGTELLVRVDKDAQPTAGVRTLGSTSPNPDEHGQVVKADFNERDVIVPLVAMPPPTPTPTPTVTVTPTATGPTPTPTPGPPATPMCGAAPVGACRTPVVPGKGRILLKDKTPDKGDRLVWKWSKGAATMLAELGDPHTSTSYDLCIYDGTGALVMQATAPAGGLCGAKSPRPCWKTTKKGYRYNDRDLTPMGLQKADLKAGEDGKAKMQVKGKGDMLDLPDLPIQDLPVTVQLVNRLGVCWETVFSETRKNTEDQFKAKSE